MLTSAHCLLYKFCLALLDGAHLMDCVRRLQGLMHHERHSRVLGQAGATSFRFRIPRYSECHPSLSTDLLAMTGSSHIESTIAST